MKKILISLITIFLFQTAPAQNILVKYLPTSAYTVQYAGSIGFLSAGYFRQSPKKKIELGLLYGHASETYGGPLNAFTLKLIYNPFSINVSSKFCWEPIQTGLFLAAWFGENLDVSWSGRYPGDYYWWQSSTRKHIFLSSQFSYIINKKYVDKLSLYFEANTNDLYLYNYIPNPKSQKLYDIIFYGIGCKLYMK